MWITPPRADSLREVGPLRETESTLFDEFFERGAGFAPHAYQRTMAEADSLPDVVDVPTGHGKTAAIVLAWLWHWLRDTPPAARRLVITLPMRTLVEQTQRSIERWLANLGLTDRIDVVVLMGGTARSIANDWRANPDRPSILIGTVDVVVSKALVRGYATARHAYPMDAALLWNDCHVVIDETQLAAASTRTLRQVRAFQRLARQAPFGTVGLTCMSATIDRALLDTVDHPIAGAKVATLTDDDADADIRRRRAAARTVRGCALDVGKPKDIAAHVVSRHRRGTLTLVIVNTVATAREVYTALRKQATEADSVLLHSRFRPADRAPLVERAVGAVPPEGRIVVSTQVIEAGVDVDAALLVTEASSWPSFVQRVGRCNRVGLLSDAEVHWLRPGRVSPYPADDLEQTVAALERLEGSRVTSAELLALGGPTSGRTPPTIRRADFLSLFDTAPDLSGNDLDIAPYIRDSDDLDVYLCWAQWEGRVRDDQRVPPHDARCAVSIKDVREFQKRVTLWRRLPTRSGWQPVSSGPPIRPGEVLLVCASNGGYVQDTGFDARSTAPVPPIADETPTPLGDPETETSNASDELAVGCADWIPLDQHLLETEEEARALVTACDLSADVAADVVLAARLHDVGKAHPVWQDAICALAGDGADPVLDGRPWAKSASRGRPNFGGAAFRHEFAGVLALQTSFESLLHGAHDRDLVLYLVMAHHGKLRVTVRELGASAEDWCSASPMANEPTCPTCWEPNPRSSRPSSIRQFALDGDLDRHLPAWADTMQDLLDRYGPFRLAYLETLVRAADWRASARHDAGRRT